MQLYLFAYFPEIHSSPLPYSYLSIGIQLFSCTSSLGLDDALTFFKNLNVRSKEKLYIFSGEESTNNWLKVFMGSGVDIILELV